MIYCKAAGGSFEQGGEGVGLGVGVSEVGLLCVVLVFRPGKARRRQNMGL